MRVELPEGLLANPDHRGPLTALILMCHLAWLHRPVIEGPLQEWKDWLDSICPGTEDGGVLRDDLKQSWERWQLEEAQPAAVPTARNTVRLKDQGAPTWERFPHRVVELQPEAALSLLNRSLDIYVENGINDRAFLLRICTAQDRQLLLKWERAGALRFVHGGGKNTLLDLLKHDQDHDDPTRMERRLLLSAMVDSDRLSPESRLPKTQMELERRCRKMGLPLWILKRRSIENYLPEGALKGHRSELIEAWRSLSTPHRHHANLKRGVLHDLEERTDMTEAERDFWAQVPQEVVRALGRGFGRGLAEAALSGSGPDAWRFDEEAVQEAAPFILQLREML